MGRLLPLLCGFCVLCFIVEAVKSPGLQRAVRVGSPLRPAQQDGTGLDPHDTFQPCSSVGLGFMLPSRQEQAPRESSSGEGLNLHSLVWSQRSWWSLGLGPGWVESSTLISLQNLGIEQPMRTCRLQNEIQGWSRRGAVSTRALWLCILDHVAWAWVNVLLVQRDWALRESPVGDGPAQDRGNWAAPVRLFVSESFPWPLFS